MARRVHRRSRRVPLCEVAEGEQAEVAAPIRPGLLTVVNRTRDRVLGDAIREADSFFRRARGLLGADDLPDGDGLWICPCTSIHSFGMRIEFDALFLDARRRVVGMYSRFRRNRMSRIFWSARGVLELPAGMIERTGTKVGDEIEFQR